jgi:DNA-binding CsgD family transcriptional regulator
MGGKLFRLLGGIADATGSPEFYPRVAESLATMLRCKHWLVVRYGLYGPPELIVNNAMSDEAVELYAEGLYRLDPLLRLVKSGKRDGVFLISDIRDKVDASAYFENILRISVIRDEAAVLLATPGNSSLAICIDRPTGYFSKRHRDFLRTLHPLIRSLHLVHLDRVFSAPPRGPEGNLRGKPQNPVLILDKQNQAVYRNEAWAVLERQRKIPNLATVRNNRSVGVQNLGANWVLHWEVLDEGFALAPGGVIYTIETPGAGFISTNLDDALNQFRQKHQLTRRQREIVELVLQGYPNSRIAERLRLTEGTIRNYRLRLYYKLDITTERELFFQFIAHLLGREDMPPTHSTGSRSAVTPLIPQLGS